MASLIPSGRQKYSDNTGAPLVGGQLFTYLANTTVPKATFADAAGTVPNTNPVVLDARGEATIFWSGSYKVVLKDALNNVIWTVDNIAEIDLGSRTSSNGSLITPAGTTAQRDAQPVPGYHRYNVDTDTYESFIQNAWVTDLKTINGATPADVNGNLNIKTINGGALTGAGDLGLQPTLVSATNIKTVGGVSVLGAGDIAVQSPLVSGTNLKTVNGISLLGAGNLLTAASVVRSARIANQMLAVADIGTLVDITAGTFTQTFDTPANLGNGWNCWLRNSGTGDITIPTSDGVNNWIMYPGEARLFQCDGTNIFSVVITPFTRVVTSSITFVRPPGYNTFDLEMWGGGGGGGSGASISAVFGYCGGGGGAPGGYIRRQFAAAEVGASIIVTIGAGGNGGAIAGGNGSGGPSGAATNGNPGTPGGSSSFGTLVTVTGGSYGTGGNSTVGSTASGGSVLGLTTAPYFGGNGGANVISAPPVSPANTLMTGAGGGAGGGSYNNSGLTFAPGATGANRGPVGTSGGAGGAASTTGTAVAGGAGGPFQGGGGGGCTSFAAVGAPGGAGGIASGGGGGGSWVFGSGSYYASGAGGAGGPGYAIIRGQ